MADEPDKVWKLPWTARCRCERLQMRVTAPPIVTMACHCAGCQRMCASAFSLSVLLPSSGFEVGADGLSPGLADGLSTFSRFCFMIASTAL